MRRILTLLLAVSLLSCSATAPSAIDDDEAAGTVSADGKSDSYGYSSCQVTALLTFLNDTADFQLLRNKVGLSTRASNNLVAGRPYDSLLAVDKVAWVGEKSIQRLVEYAASSCTAPEQPSEACQVEAMLKYLNERATIDELRSLGLSSSAAQNLINDRPYTTVQQVDDVKWVGEKSIEKLLAHVKDDCAADFLPVGSTYSDKLPTLSDPVQQKNEWCAYKDEKPFVAKVNWEHPAVKNAQAILAQTSYSMMTYTQWRNTYQLEDDWSKLASSYTYGDDQQKAEIDEKLKGVNFRNFIKVLCGEYRDYPAMIRRKLQVVTERTLVVPSGYQADLDESKALWSQITGEGYRRLRQVMSQMYEYRWARLPGNSYANVYNYNFGEIGHDANRTEVSVPPFTHCEMKFVFKTYLKGSSFSIDPASYETQYAQYKKDCDPQKDLGYFYNFRGHKNFKPLWFESNAFIWLSRVAADKLTKNGDISYYQRPFATRYAGAKAAWGSHLFYPESHHQWFRQASEQGGGPHLYIEDEDRNNDGLADYRLFQDVMGQGDIGLGSQALPLSRMDEVTPTQDSVAGFDAELFRTSADWGFLTVFTTFEKRMARINQAFDRHTNWGPTHLYSPSTRKIYGAYSPIVACSYMIDASHWFATSDYPSTHPAEQGKTKWMFIQKLPVADYYDEVRLANGDPLNWDRMYFNETSLSNDFYRERALDKFGWAPKDVIDFNLYLIHAQSE